MVQNTISLENGWETQFLTTPLWSCGPCNKFGIFVANKFENLWLLLINFARGLKYLDDVELTHRGDEDQVCLKQSVAKIFEYSNIFVNIPSE